MADDADLSRAISRLEAFCSTFNAGDQVDEESGLTAEDLSSILDAARRGARVVPIRQWDLRNPPPPNFIPE